MVHHLEIVYEGEDGLNIHSFSDTLQWIKKAIPTNRDGF
jgi:hypothetical protein